MGESLLMEVTEGKVSEEQGGLRKGKGCVDQIFGIKMMLKVYLGKNEKLYARKAWRERSLSRDKSGNYLRNCWVSI